MYVTNDRAMVTAADRVDVVLRELRDRAEILDALYRFGLGQDVKDRTLFASAFAADAELDFRPAAAKWGARPPVMPRMVETPLSRPSWACSPDASTPLIRSPTHALPSTATPRG